jgi:hypothetical protein
VRQGPGRLDLLCGIGDRHAVGERDRYVQLAMQACDLAEHERGIGSRKGHHDVDVLHRDVRRRGERDLLRLGLG